MFLPLPGVNARARRISARNDILSSNGQRYHPTPKQGAATTGVNLSSLTQSTTGGMLCKIRIGVTHVQCPSSTAAATAAVNHPPCYQPPLPPHPVNSSGGMLCRMRRSVSGYRSHSYSARRQLLLLLLFTRITSLLISSLWISFSQICSL